MARGPGGPPPHTSPLAMSAAEESALAKLLQEHQEYAQYCREQDPYEQTIPLPLQELLALVAAGSAPRACVQLRGPLPACSSLRLAPA